MADGGLTIVNQQVQGTNSGGDSGDIRTAETYSSDQSSQVQLTSTPVTGNQWVGPAIAPGGRGRRLRRHLLRQLRQPRADAVLAQRRGLCQLGASVPVSPLAAGTTLSLSVTGSTLTFADNGTTAITATDTTLTGGAPGIMANGLATATNWSGTGVTTTTTTTTTAPTTTTTAPTDHDHGAYYDDHHGAEQHHDYRSRHDHDYLRGWGLGQRASGQTSPGLTGASAPTGPTWPTAASPSSTSRCRGPTPGATPVTSAPPRRTPATSRPRSS